MPIKKSNKKQKLVAVRISTSASAGTAPAIEPVGGEPLDKLLEEWRIVQIQPLGNEAGADGRYAALLLLEEAQGEAGFGRLGFGAT